MPSVRSWAYPDCPECESDVFVMINKGYPHAAQYRCTVCGTCFSKFDDDE